MPFVKREDLEAEAISLGIDPSDYKYQDLIAAVSRAKEKDKTAEEKTSENLKVNRDLKWGRKAMDDIAYTNIIIAPKIRPELANVLFKYKEDLGSQPIVEEVHYDLYNLDGANNNTSLEGNFRILGDSGEHVVATCSFPKENAGISYKPGQDWFPVVEDATTGQRGYQFTKYVKPLLIKAGIYHKYEEYFDSNKHPNNCFYICGHSCVDKDLVDWIFSKENNEH